MKEKIEISTPTPVLTKIYMLVLALYPLLGWYDINFSLSLGGTLMLFLSVFVIATKGFKINVLHKSFWFVFSYVCLVLCIRNGFATWTILPPGGWLFFLFFISLVAGVITFNVSLLTKYMKWIVWIAIALFFIQYIILHTTGSNICFVLNLTGKFTYEELTFTELAARHRSSSHPCSIFMEKSYMAHYLITYLLLLLYGSNKSEKWWNKEVLIIIAALVLLRSGSGMVVLPVLMMVKIISTFWNGNKSRSIILLFFAVLVAIGTFFVYSRTESGAEVLSRQEELSTEGTSGYTRVVAGYMMFESQSLNDQIWGASRGQLVDDYGHSKEGTFTLYINGFQTILLTLGYLGTFFYLLFYIILFRKVSILGRMSIIILLVMSLLESNYLNAYMLLFTLIPCAEYNLISKCNKR